MLILGIETSGYQGSVALARDGECLIESQLNQAGRRHAQSLVLEIGEALKTNGLRPQDVELVAVSRGPGSFTGLRVGMTCAKTFAYATRCRFIAVDTFAAIAENLPQDMTRVQIIEDAQRDDLFVAEFQRAPTKEWIQRAPIQTISVGEFLSAQTPDCSITGPGIKKLKSLDCPAKLFSELEYCQPRASIIAKLGWRLAQTNDASETTHDFWKAVPFYVRASAAEEKRDSLKAAP